MLSLVGTWMQSTAQGYLIFQLTGSPLYLGYVGFAAGVPSWLFMLYGGLIADRIPRRTMLLVTQVRHDAAGSRYGALDIHRSGPGLADRDHGLSAGGCQCL